MENIYTSIISFINIYTINYINTGNKVYDGIITTLIMSLITFIISKNILFLYIMKLYNYIVYLIYNNKDLLSFNCKYYITDNAINIYNNYKTIHITNTNTLYNKLNMLKSNIKNKKQLLYVNNESDNFTLHKYYGNIYYENNNINKEKSHIIILELLYCYKYLIYIGIDRYENKYILYCDSIEYLFIFVDKLNNLDLIDNSSVKKIYKLKNIKSQSGLKNSGLEHFSNISLKKTINNIFFDDKQIIIDILDKFKEQKLYPANVNMDNKLGIFIYGKPGTGKTGLISAIANYLNYDIIVINFKTNYTISEYEFLFKNETYKQKIIVFDEIDFLIKKFNDLETEKIKENKTKTIIINSSNPMQNKSNSLIDSSIQFNNEETETITLEYLLSKLDGVEQSDNRIIIATTNHPEVFEERFLRPGRFDIHLEMKYCSKNMYIDIISNFYSIDKKLLSKYKFINEKHSPLEVQNLCIKNKNYKITCELLCN